MYNFTDVDVYLHLITDAENYTSIKLDDRQKLVFTAYEQLSSFYSEPLLTTKIIALQALYMANNKSIEGEEAAALQTIKEAGAKSYSIDGVSVTFDDKDVPLGISPTVAAIIDKLTPGAYVGRLI